MSPVGEMPCYHPTMPPPCPFLRDGGGDGDGGVGTGSKREYFPI